jgi:rod shape-determining protein MreC
MRFTLLDSQGNIPVGARLVTFGDVGQRPFVPEVPIGRVTRVLPTAGQLYRQGVVAPFVSFSSLSVVGVVVASPRTIPRDSLVPPSPSPSPSGTPPARSARPNRSPAPSPSPS